MQNLLDDNQKKQVFTRQPDLDENGASIEIQKEDVDFVEESEDDDADDHEGDEEDEEGEAEDEKEGEVEV